MPGKGNQRIMLRLPPNHWAWSIEDAETRNKEIRLALELYQHTKDKFETIAKVTEEIKKIREGLGQGLAYTQEKKSEDKKPEAPEDRLLANMEKFLEF